MMIKLLVNGKNHEISPDSTIMHLIESLALNPKQVAVELNRVIVKKEYFESTVLHEADEVEVLHFVGGGCYSFQP